MIIKVKDTYTGKIGTIDDSELSPRYQPIEQAQQPVQQIAPQTTPIVQTPQSPKGNILQSIFGFLAPTTQAVGQDITASGQVGGYTQSMNKSTQDLVNAALELRKARQTGGDVTKAYQKSKALSGQELPIAPEFSKDINKSYLERGAKTGLELGSYMVPAGKGIKSAMGLGALSGAMKTASESDTSLSKIASGAAGAGLTSGLMYGLFDLGGKLLQGSGEKLTLKGLRPSKSQIFKFNEKTGENLTDFVQQNKLFEKGTEQVDNILNGLYSQYDDVAIKSGKKIPVSKILNAFDNKIDELSKYTGTEIEGLINKLSTEKMAVAQKLADQSEVGLDWFVKNRRMLDKVIPEGAFTTDPITAGGKKIVRDLYKGIIDNTTEGATKSIGSKINKFESFKDIAKLQQGLGQGNLPAGLMQILATGSGAGIGYGQGKDANSAIKGALVGYGLTTAANNPKVISTLSQILMSTGKKATTVPNNFIPQLISRVGGQKLGEQIPSLGGVQAPSTQVPMGTSGIEKQNVSQQQPQYNQGTNIIPPQKTTTLTGHTPDQHAMAYQRAMAAGDTAEAEKIYSQYEKEVKYQAESQTTQKATNEVSDTIASIDTVLKRNLNPVTGIWRVLGNVPGTNAYDTRRMVEQVKSQLQLASVGKLKGQGQVSDAERRILADAATALDSGMTEKAFRDELNKVRKILERNIK